MKNGLEKNLSVKTQKIDSILTNFRFNSCKKICLFKILSNQFWIKIILFILTWELKMSHKKVFIEISSSKITDCFFTRVTLLMTILTILQEFGMICKTLSVFIWIFWQGKKCKLSFRATEIKCLNCVSCSYVGINITASLIKSSVYVELDNDDSVRNETSSSRKHNIQASEPLIWLKQIRLDNAYQMSRWLLLKRESVSRIDKGKK